jgi:hypothetical protein
VCLVHDVAERLKDCDDGRNGIANSDPTAQPLCHNLITHRDARTLQRPALTVEHQSRQIRTFSNCVRGHHVPMQADAAPDPIRLFFRAEDGAESPICNERGHMVWLEQLPLPEPLRAHLSAWAFDAFQTDDDGGLAGEGRRLFRQAETYLRAGYTLTWDYGDEPRNDPFATF